MAEEHGTGAMNAYQPVEWEVFVVRIVTERPSGAWRGQVTHLPDRAATPFNSLEQLALFLARFVPELDAGPSADVTDE